MAKYNLSKNNCIDAIKSLYETYSILAKSKEEILSGLGIFFVDTPTFIDTSMQIIIEVAEALCNNQDGLNNGVIGAKFRQLNSSESFDMWVKERCSGITLSSSDLRNIVHLLRKVNFNQTDSFEKIIDAAGGNRKANNSKVYSIERHLISVIKYLFSCAEEYYGSNHTEYVEYIASDFGKPYISDNQFFKAFNWLS